eukprot:1376783-Amphidinium_carterae.1
MQQSDLELQNLSANGVAADKWGANEDGTKRNDCAFLSHQTMHKAAIETQVLGKSTFTSCFECGDNCVMAVPRKGDQYSKGIGSTRHIDRLIDR